VINRLTVVYVCMTVEDHTRTIYMKHIIFILFPVRSNIHVPVWVATVPSCTHFSICELLYVIHCSFSASHKFSSYKNVLPLIQQIVHSALSFAFS
jgi:hypothetical protein